MRRVILIDVMDTLVQEPFFERAPGFLGLTLEELMAAKHPTVWAEFERGEIEGGRFDLQRLQLRLDLAHRRCRCRASAACHAQEQPGREDRDGDSRDTLPDDLANRRRRMHLCDTLLLPLSAYRVS